VRTDKGVVEGVVQEGVEAFKGVPFAAAPVGDLRWRAPQPSAAWEGVRATKDYAPACPQSQAGGAAMGFAKLPTSEDCLYLNIWTPVARASEPLPVMVGIYGGAFIAGATALPVYNGEALANKGVVVVSISYRIGALGFLAHPELSAESPAHASGNYGLMDLVAGLEWVKHNIAQFGGDPGRVTIFGESAGATAIGMLAASPKARGLFHGAISESGGAFAPARKAEEGGQTTPTLTNAEQRGTALLTKIGAAGIAAARKIPADDLVRMTTPLAPPPTLWPVLDGDFLPDNPYKLYQARKYNNVPVLAGTNSDEGAMFVPPTTVEAYKAGLRKDYGRYADVLLANYPAGSDAQALRSARDLFGDTIMAWPTRAWAKLQAGTGGKKVFLYHFSHPAPRPNMPWAKGLGALHGDEIAYVFGNASPHWTPDDRALSDIISSYWVNFARTGNPNGAGLPEWPAFRADFPRVLALDVNPSVSPIPNLKNLEVLDKYYAWRRGEPHQ
jgi:para-nitrobenzyl esterase